MFCSFRVVVSMVYYGLALGSSDLAGNPFINLALAGLVELPALILMYFTLDRFGRRVIQTGSLALSGVACLLVPAIPSGEWSRKSLHLWRAIKCSSSDTCVNHILFFGFLFRYYLVDRYPDHDWEILRLSRICNHLYIHSWNIPHPSPCYRSWGCLYVCESGLFTGTICGRPGELTLLF